MHSLGFETCPIMDFGGLIHENSWIVLHYIKLHYSHCESSPQDRWTKEANWIIWGYKTRFREQEPWIWDSLLLFSHEKFTLQYETIKVYHVHKGYNRLKATNRWWYDKSSIKLPEHTVNLFQIRFSLNLHLISINRRAGKREKQAYPSDAGKTWPLCNTTGFLCPSTTLTAAFCHSLRPTNLQGTAVILKLYGHHRLYDCMVTAHHVHLVSYSWQNNACHATCRNWTILKDSLVVLSVTSS